jgi:hypothetical protein
MIRMVTKKLLGVGIWMFVFLGFGSFFIPWIASSLDMEKSNPPAPSLAVFQKHWEAFQTDDAPRRVWIGACYAAAMADIDASQRTHSYNLALGGAWSKGFKSMLEGELRPEDELIYLFSLLDVTNLETKPRPYINEKYRQAQMIQRKFQFYIMPYKPTPATPISADTWNKFKRLFWLKAYPNLDINNTISNIEYTATITEKVVMDFFGSLAWHPNTVFIFHTMLPMQTISGYDCFAAAVARIVKAQRLVILGMPDTSIDLSSTVLPVNEMTSLWHVTGQGSWSEYNKLQEAWL